MVVCGCLWLLCFSFLCTQYFWIYILSRENLSKTLIILIMVYLWSIKESISHKMPRVCLFSFETEDMVGWGRSRHHVASGHPYFPYFAYLAFPLYLKLLLSIFVGVHICSFSYISFVYIPPFVVLVALLQMQ